MKNNVRVDYRFYRFQLKISFNTFHVGNILYNVKKFFNTHLQMIHFEK